MVRVLHRIHLHPAHVRAGSASDTRRLIHLVPEHGNRVKHRVHCPQGTYIFTEGPVDHDGQEHGHGQQYHFPRIQPSKGAPHGPVQKDKWNPPFQCARRTDQLAEVRLALPYDIHKKQGQQDHKHRENNVF